MIVKPCPRCGEKVTFIINRKTKKPITCDWGLVPFWESPYGKSQVITEDGDLFQCRLSGKPECITDVGHVPHALTCPNRKIKRRKK